LFGVENYPFDGGITRPPEDALAVGVELFIELKLSAS
jgi:hypothetical protein